MFSGMQLKSSTPQASEEKPPVEAAPIEPKKPKDAWEMGKNLIKF